MRVAAADAAAVWPAIRRRCRCPCETDASIRIDAGQLEQVLFNLVLNSRDAMPEGGGSRSTPRTSGTGDHAAIGIVVADTGVGMDAETLARCREPFFTTKGRRGIGLGLGTVSTIVERSGGRLDIKSEPGRGHDHLGVLPDRAGGAGGGTDRAAVVSSAGVARRRRRAGPRLRLQGAERCRLRRHSGRRRRGGAEGRGDERWLRPDRVRCRAARDERPRPRAELRPRSGPTPLGC